MAPSIAGGSATGNDSPGMRGRRFEFTGRAPSQALSRQARLLRLDGAREPRTRRSEAWRLSPYSPKPSRLAHQREEGAARRRIRMHVCKSSTPTAASTVCSSAPARAEAAEFGRRARHAPTARIFDFPAERTGFGSQRERCCRGPAGRAEARDLRAKRPSPPRCREANGGVAVVAAGAAMNRNGGHHAEVEHP